MDDATYYFSGTLGDAYIALCKLASRSHSAPCKLRRLERSAGIDGMIAQVVALFPGVTYVSDYIHFTTIEEMRQFAFGQADRYINIFFDGNGRENEPDDPPDLSFVPFPALQLPQPPRGTEPVVAVQLHSGSRPTHPRGLDVGWVEDFSRLLVDQGVEVVILGTGDGYSDDDRRRLASPGGGHSLLGATSLLEWMGWLSHVDYLVAPDGFATFFALSQHVPTLLAFEEINALLRMPRVWRDNALCVRPKRVPVPGGIERWAPLTPQDAATLVLARLSPEKA